MIDMNALLPVLLFAGCFAGGQAGLLDKDDNPLVSLGCYKCSSVNNSDPDCADEFVAKEEYYTPNCMAAKKRYNGADQHSSDVRVGLYPATSCIKFWAIDKETGVEHVVRDCAVDSGGTTYDTEIGGMTHCGLMRNLKYNGKDMRGCILTCKINGCNGASALTPLLAVVAVSMLASTLKW